MTATGARSATVRRTAAVLQPRHRDGLDAGHGLPSPPAPDLPRGEYELYLQDEWQLEKVVDGVAEPVVATLLSSRYQYVYIYPHSTSWVEFQFGIGDKTLWLNGQFTVNVQVYEDPDEYYDNGGEGGYGGGPRGTGGAYYGTGAANTDPEPLE